MVIHHVFANRSNIGDWLAARGIQHHLRLPVVEHLCDDPFIDGALAALDRAAPDDLVVIGGGGLFMDYFTPLWERVGELGARVRTVVWGVGVVDIKREDSLPSLELIERVARASRVCVVRDELTREWLSELELGPPVPCPSLAAVDPAPGPGFGVLHVNNHSTAGADVYEVMREEAKAFAARTGRQYWETNNRVQPDSERQLRALLDRYAAADVIVSSALHGCVIGLATGRPVVAVSGDRKIESFMEAAGLADWVLTQEAASETGALLERAAGQAGVAGFVAEARRRNEAVGAEVRALASGREVTAGTGP